MTNVKPLLNDVARCHGERCVERESCARYVYRNTGGKYVVFFKPEPPQDKKCDYHLPFINKTPVEK